MNVTVEIETPKQKVVTEMLDKLDTYLSELYPPESNHFPETEQLSYSNTLFCVARYNDIALGCGAALLKFEQENAYAEIKRMYVHEEYRGEGVGVKILKFLHLKIASKGIYLARLETGFSQFDAIKLYEKLGYYRISPFGDYEPDPLSLFFEKQIL